MCSQYTLECVHYSPPCGAQTAVVPLMAPKPCMWAVVSCCSLGVCSVLVTVLGYTQIELWSSVVQSVFFLLSVCVCVCACMHVSVHACVRTCVCVYVSVCASVHVCLYVYVCACMRTVCMRVTYLLYSTCD